MSRKVKGLCQCRWRVRIYYCQRRFCVLLLNKRSSIQKNLRILYFIWNMTILYSNFVSDATAWFGGTIIGLFSTVTIANLESDNRKGLILTIDTQKIKERYGWLKGSLCYKWDLLATLEHLTRHVFINPKCYFCHINWTVISGNICVPVSFYELSFVSTTGIFTPKALQVYTAKGHIGSKDGVNLLIVAPHDGHLIIRAAQGFVNFISQIWADSH